MDLSIPVLSDADVNRALSEQTRRFARPYAAMYSSWLGGIVRGVEWMLVPIDDHMVHRGDGIFEAFRIANGAFYDLESHLQRLQRSADGVGITLPNSVYDIEQICRQTAHVTGLREGLVRLFVSRGPGGFTTNPYESLGSQLYVVITPFTPVPEEKYHRGATALQSQIAVKEAPYCGIKSCNYLPNVMMKKEAVDLGVDYTLSVDSEGGLAEGSTENFFVINNKNEFVAPLFQRTLQGTTLLRCMELAKLLVSEGVLTGVRQDKLSCNDLIEAQEANLAGTTIGVLPLVEFSGKGIGNGKPGPIGKKLRELLIADMNENRQRRSLIFS